MPGFFYFAKEADELVADGEPNSSFFRFRDTDADAQFRQFDETVGWPAISMAVVEHPKKGRVVVAVSPHGDYWELESLSAEERVGTIAKFTGNLRRLIAVDGEFFACGMNRVVLRRTKPGKWTSIGPGALEDDPAVVGFEAIGGYSATELYAVGWGGEIWWYDGEQWQRVDSPTSVILSSMTCAPDGFVYVVGHDSVMVKGRRDHWELVDTGWSEDFRDVAQLDGQVYVCTDSALLTFQESGLVEETDFAPEEDRPATCLQLLESAGELVSLGGKDVFVKRDAAWHRLV
jgi:hypothetical protein